MYSRRSFIAALIAFILVSPFFMTLSHAQLDACHTKTETECNADPDCHFCPVEGIYGCKDINLPCTECADLDETYCEQGVGCYWCRNKNQCLEVGVSCTCGDGFLQPDEECEIFSGDPNCVDCLCINGFVEDRIQRDCNCTEDAQCDDGLSCNGVETCGADGECVGGKPTCADDGLWCNGDEICDWGSDSCVSRGLPSAGGLALGDNQYGQLGDGSTADADIPVQIVASGVLRAAAGKSHSLFVKEDGSLWGMGRNGSCQLGLMAIYGSNKNKPVEILPDLGGVVDVAAGNAHTLYTTFDGKLFALGRNNAGQLGIGSDVNACHPVAVDTGGAVVSIAAGGDNSAFILADGTFRVMGDNGSGQLGDPSISLTEDQTTPLTVSVPDVREVSVGPAHMVFAAGEGELFVMGSNEFGQLGTGDTTDRTSPVSIAASGVTAVAAGAEHSLFVRRYEADVNWEGALFGMGSAGLGQLGNDSQIRFSSPVLVVRDGVQTVTAGKYHTVFLRSQSDGCLIDGACVAAGTPSPENAGLVCDPAVSRAAWTPYQDVSWSQEAPLAVPGLWGTGEDCC